MRPLRRQARDERFVVLVLLIHLDPFSRNTRTSYIGIFRHIGYFCITENDDTDYQNGQELDLDVVFNQFLSETFAIGLHGFYLKQIAGDSGSGALLGDFKAEAAGIGPALLWSTKIGSQDGLIIAKWLHEFHAENRLEGNPIFLGFAVDW